jgi:SAM-dependent methyltransferase
MRNIGETGVKANTRTTFWEDVATTRWGAYTSDVARRAILRAHELSPVPTTAVDLGCEGGRWSKLLTDLGWNMVCTDVDEEVLRLCQKRIPTAKCLLAKPGGNTLECSSQSADLLLCMEVPPVIHSQWFLLEAERVLRDRGLIVGVFWNRMSFRAMFVNCVNERNSGSALYQRSYSSWKRNLPLRGFRMLYEEGYCWFPFRRKSNSIFIPYFIRLERRLHLHRLIKFSPWIAFIAQKSLLEASETRIV